MGVPKMVVSPGPANIDLMSLTSLVNSKNPIREFLAQRQLASRVYMNRRFSAVYEWTRMALFEAVRLGQTRRYGGCDQTFCHASNSDGFSR